MSNKILDQIKKEFLLVKYSYGILELVIYSSSYMIIFSFLIRHNVQIIDNFSSIILPGFLLLFIVSLFRFFLNSMHEEIEKNIFYTQLKFDPSSSIYFIKLFSGIIFSVILLFIQSIILVFFLGIPDYSYRILISLLSISICIPIVTMITQICSIISIHNNKGEVITPIISFPLLIILCTSVLQISEDIFLNSNIVNSLFWVKIIIGMTIILGLFSSSLFRFLILGLGRKLER